MKYCSLKPIQTFRSQNGLRGGRQLFVIIAITIITVEVRFQMNELLIGTGTVYVMM